MWYRFYGVGWLVGELTHSKWMHIEIDVLPMAYGYGVDFVHDAKMVVLFDGLVPEIPASAMDIAPRKSV